VGIPLNSAQLDIYFDQLKAPESPLYNVGGYLKLGSINTKRFTESNKRVIDEDDIFGLIIRSDSNGVAQYVSNKRNKYLPLKDFSNFKNPELSAQKFMQVEFNTSFELENNPLFKNYLLKLSEDSSGSLIT
jgi:hypothetical protein